MTMPSHLLTFRLTVAAFAALTAFAAAAAPSMPDAVAHGLRPRVIIDGEADPTYDILERMRRYRVSSVSVALVRGGVIDWAGVFRLPDAPPADTNTLYQAASISKGVTGALAHRLARAGKIKLDLPVDACLKPLVLPAGQQSAAHPVTLRGLLSHSAGAGISGFPGYPPSGPVATDIQIITGEAPSLTGAVTIQTVPGVAYAYSGGGYTVAQVAMAQCTHTPFAQLMRKEVLDPLGMRRSTFAQPLPAAELNHARGHYFDGSEIEGGAFVYPELAAAGLWTTASDLARFAIGVRQSWKSGGAFLTQAQARDFLTPGLNSYAQGLFVVGEGEHKRFQHSGGNTGFKSTYSMYLESGDGVVVLTDGDNGTYLGGEIVKAIAAAYGWPDFQPRVAKPAPLDVDAARRYLGVYKMDVFDGRFENRYELAFEGNAWILITPDIGATRLVPTGAASFVSPETGDIIELASDGGLTMGGRKAHRAAP